jgi:multiple sugar transport system permease protein
MTASRFVAGRGVKGERRPELIAGIALISVPMLLFLVLNIGAIFYAAYISLWRWGLRGPRAFLGVSNYQAALSDPIFIKAVTNTFYYVVIWVPLTMALGLFLAIIVNQKLRGQTFFRATFYFPALASSAAITVVWIFLLQPSGLFNEVRQVLGVNPLFRALGFADDQNWIATSNTAMNSIIALNAWTTSGTIMLFYLTFLQTISKEIYEAAAIDGAGAWQAFRSITFPLLRPAHFFVATLLFIGGFQLFDQAIIAGGQGGEPNNALTTIVLFIYRSAITDSEFGFAAAVGMILLVLIFTVTLIQRRVFGDAPSW